MIYKIVMGAFCLLTMGGVYGQVIYRREPALIPKPSQLQRTAALFHLYACSTISISDDSLIPEANRLRRSFLGKGVDLHVARTTPDNEPAIVLDLVHDPSLTGEAYRLTVDEKRITITAASTHGIFNGLQTLDQWACDGKLVNGCVITDAPAFTWRGYMVDVGRNYQSLPLLEQQIDVMSRYKLNVFHFHCTEDLAWRLAIDRYPQLTAPENMLRGKGLFYTKADIQRLIAYCKERHILFVPEIDMPGHSAAFTRAMKTNMQSDTGLMIIKNILREICATYDVPYLHIGGDEVKITNRSFLPEVVSYVEATGKKTIGWSPGGNIGPSPLRQLWMGDAPEDSLSPAIDSRHLYLNHMDPEESVVTIFKRRIGNRSVGDKNMLGGEICLWHDRNVANEEDVMKMNPVYPAMLAFAERSWCGGGWPGWTTDIGPQVDGFTAFEDRLWDHRQRYFKRLPFPYVRQAQLSWDLYGPYANKPAWDQPSGSQPSLKVRGGTIILRHWWYPQVTGILTQPEENSTWYAHTVLWSRSDTVIDCWIGAYNISRSMRTAVPPKGQWDNRGTEIRVNGAVISAPDWTHAGSKPDLESPLTDEGYEYREPTRVALHKGANPVWIKLPVGSFKAVDWNDPVKWMFTFLPLAGPSSF